jgi:hypothetical protein
MRGQALAWAWVAAAFGLYLAQFRDIAGRLLPH